MAPDISVTFEEFEISFCDQGSVATEAAGYYDGFLRQEFNISTRISFQISQIILSRKVGWLSKQFLGLLLRVLPIK